MKCKSSIMYNRKSLWLILFLLVFQGWAHAERVFILFDENCMDRLEYKQVSQAGSYIVYQVNVAPGERILLEVGQESGEYRGNMPTPVIGCSTGIFDARMVENINRGVDEVFVIHSLSNGRHTITQVSMAGEYQYNQRALAFDSPKYDFRFDLENGSVGENIAVPSTQREVFFEGRMEEQCLGAYIFRQFAPRSAKPHMDMVFIPNIGIVEERAGFTLDEALSNAIKLESINGVPLQSRIQQLCNQQGSTAGNSLVLSPYGSEVTPANVFDEAPEMVIKTPVTNSSAAATSSGLANRTAAQTHTIVKGETLYRLSKQYGVTIAQLKDWNNLKSNTIYKGHQLIVSDPTGAPATSGTVQSASIASSNPGGSMPVPYGDDGQRLNVTAKGVNTATQEYHTVRTGETVASIAMKYGYTEERFREMNDLQTHEYPKIGQRLITNDCDCPDVPVSTSNTLTPRTINPYNNTATSPTSTNSLYQNTTTTSSPINNYSYPSPSSYEEGATNPNTRPFSNYSDIPVPATGTLTAPNNYSNTGAANQGANYSNYNNTNIRGVNSYDNTASRPTGMKRSHIVKDGENLYDIARQYGTTVNILRQLNRLDANEVVIPNQKIFLE